ncbi:MAG: GT4 family glycosyltransferase PelF, partial [Planctomycetota bacterium]|nr:GT4 family glycosyltransferase PelF [Planctomycetota bacterium]
MKRADICLILEGTYPFVSGGVSSWVHHLTSRLTDHTFSILHISPKRGFFDEHVYTMPDNIVGVREVYLHDYVLSSKGRPADLRDKVLRFRNLAEDMREGRSGSFAAFLKALQSDGNEGFSSFDLLQTHESWRVLVDTYRAEADDESFLNFFWTWRYAYLPLFNLLSTKIPRARVYHTISTGYAGML